MTMKDKKIGFIGLGVMGAAFATRLINCEFKPLVYDVVPDLVKKITDLGASAASSTKEIGECSDIVFMSLPTPPIVLSVFQGVLEGAKPGTIVIDLSTVDPETTRKNYKLASEKGVKYLDAPVSGGAREILAGVVTFMIGGDEDVYKSCKELLEVFAKTIYYVGATGCGNVVKLTNNLISLGNNMIAAEGLVFGVKAGADPDVLYDILCHSGCRSFHLLNMYPNLLKRNFEPGFRIDLAKKDLGLALDMAKAINSPLAVTSLVHQLMTAASALGYGNNECITVAKVFEQWAGVEVKGEGKKTDVEI